MEYVSVVSMVEDAMTRIESLSPTEVAAALDGETLLVDVREPDECQKNGVLPGAIFAPRGVLEFCADPVNPHRLEEFDRGRRIILYCDTGDRSAMAADTLQRMGYWRVAQLAGGLEGWVENGRRLQSLESSIGGVVGDKGGS